MVVGARVSAGIALNYNGEDAPRTNLPATAVDRDLARSSMIRERSGYSESLGMINTTREILQRSTDRWGFTGVEATVSTSIARRWLKSEHSCNRWRLESTVSRTLESSKYSELNPPGNGGYNYSDL